MLSFYLASFVSSAFQAERGYLLISTVTLSGIISMRVLVGVSKDYSF